MSNPLGDPVQHVQHETTLGTGSYSRTSSSSLTRHGGGRGEGLRWKPSVFDFKADRSGSTCPTCKGAGRIPKGN